MANFNSYVKLPEGRSIGQKRGHRFPCPAENSFRVKRIIPLGFPECIPSGGYIPKTSIRVVGYHLWPSLWDGQPPRGRKNMAKQTRLRDSHCLLWTDDSLMFHKNHSKCPFWWPMLQSDTFWLVVLKKKQVLWLVVWNIAFIFIYFPFHILGCHPSHWLSLHHFSEGLGEKPPTRLLLTIINNH